jgi:hypothetical protein
MKIPLLVATLLYTTISAYGQGTVNFSAGSVASTRISTNSAVGGPATGLTGLNSSGYSYYYALFVADSTITSAGGGFYPINNLDPTRTAGWSQAIWASGNPAGITGAAYATNSNAAGRFTGNPTTDDLLVNGRATGSSASFIVVGWSSQVAGADWATAKHCMDIYIDSGGSDVAPGVSCWIGASAVATSVQLGGGLTSAGLIFGGNLGQVPGFTLNRADPGPEPSALSLATLSGALLLIYRRRRRTR